MSALLSVRSLVSSGLALTGGAVLQAVSGFLSQLVLMRLLVPEDFGRFVVVLAGCGLVQTLLSLRLNVLIIRTPEAEMDTARGNRYRAALVWETVASAAVTLTWLSMADLIEPYTLMLVASLALAQWTNQAAAFYERRMAYGGIVLAETGSQLVGHAAAIILVLLGSGAAALYVREIVVAVARLGVFVRLGALMSPYWRMPNFADMRLLVAEARAIWLEGAVESGFARVVVLAAGSLAGLHGAGLFTQGQRLALIPHQVLSPATNRLAANAFSRAIDPAQSRRLLVWLVSGLLVALIVAAMVAVSFADPVVPWLFGAHWAGVVDVLPAMAGLIVFMSTFEVFRAYCFAVKRVRLLLVARIGQFAVFLGCAVMPMDGAEPAVALAWSLSASYAVVFALTATGLALSRPERAGGQPSPPVPPPG